MPTPAPRFVQILLTIAIFSFANFAPRVQAQQTDRSQTQDGPTEIIRTTIELVQTEVMVFDRQGHFVNGLRPEQFELVLGGTKQPVSFFEKVTAGSQAEAEQLTAARSKPAKGKERSKAEAVASSDRGRVLFFFLDDLHLSSASLTRARKALSRFVDDQMNPNDQVAIVSTSGQVGFLQQLTDNPAVLHAAIARLNYKQTKEAYTGKTQISEFMASQIADYNNRELFAYLMDSTKLEQQMGAGLRHGDHKLASSYSAAPVVRNRVQQINAQARMATAATLNALKGLMASSAALPGRKLVFFLSDGLLINERKSGALEALEDVTEAARRSGVVVYTMDLRGTFFNMGAGIDVSNNDLADFTSRMSGLPYAELAATQEPLRLIADDTGGRAILNSNAIGDGILQAISETSEYYLLAWRPDSLEQRQGKQRLQVTIEDRPDLRVRLRDNVYQAPAPSVAKVSKDAEPKDSSAAASQTASLAPGQTQLVRTLGSLYPKKELAVSLAVGYLNANDGSLTLKLSMQIDRQALDLDPDSKTQQAELDVLGVAVDDRGQVASFKHLLTVPGAGSGLERVVTWHQQLLVKPGLYQVRVALRERSSGRTGSAMQWIELPETTTSQFGLSSLFLGERRGEVAAGAAGTAGPQPITVDVDHRFARGSALRFQTYVYNAARGEKGPDVSIATEVLRNREPIMRIAPSQVPLTNDPARLPYWSEIALQDLPPGHYVLLLTATDKISNRTASQRVNFVVE
jgi:VWFA-related protein